MIKKRYIDLFKLIEKLSKNHKLKWEETPNENTFQVFLPEFTIEIKYEIMYLPDFEDEPIQYYYLIIYNNEGKLIDEIDDAEFKKYGIGNAFESLEDIYRNARRIALRVDASLEEVMRSLLKLDDDTEAERRDEKEEALREIHRKVQGSADTEAILRIAIEEVGRVVRGGIVGRGDVEIEASEENVDVEAEDNGPF